MSQYLKWDEEIITNFSEKNINSRYSHGFLFGRQEKGMMYQTRSVRINLSQFKLSSENRRILRKTEGVELEDMSLPYSHYHWSLGKLAKDFYDTKFGDGTFSANKVKELLTEPEKSNFNLFLSYTVGEETVGYCICYETSELIHYSYPFYDLQKSPKDMGLGMMTRAAIYAQEKGTKYLYLGSAQRPTDTYKFQFAGIEWFDGEKWQTDFEQLKQELTRL